MNELKLWQIIGVIVVVIFLLLIITMITTIDAGHVGVKKVFGAVSENTLSEGLHIVA